MENENIGLWTIVADHQDITRQSKFFGLINNLTYNPTDSRLKHRDNYYLPKFGNELKDLFLKSEAAIIQQAGKGSHLEDTMNGNFQLEICYSADRQFVAMRLRQFISLQYNPITDVRFFTADAAQAVCRIIGC